VCGKVGVRIKIGQELWDDRNGHRLEKTGDLYFFMSQRRRKDRFNVEKRVQEVMVRSRRTRTRERRDIK